MIFSTVQAEAEFLEGGSMVSLNGESELWHKGTDGSEGKAFDEPNAGTLCCWWVCIYF